jgi:hypothetical protein
MKTQPFIGVSVLALGAFAFALSVAIITGSLPKFSAASEPEQVEVIAQDTPVSVDSDIEVAEVVPEVVPVVIVANATEPGAGAAKRRPERARAKSGESPQGPGRIAPSDGRPDPLARTLPERESWGPVLRANTGKTAASLKAPQAETQTYTFE